MTTPVLIRPFKQLILLLQSPAGLALTLLTFSGLSYVDLLGRRQAGKGGGGRRRRKEEAWTPLWTCHQVPA